MCGRDWSSDVCSSDLIGAEGLEPDMIIRLAENGVKNLDDLADLASDELIEILGENAISEKEAENIIMKAREHWFAEEEQTED